MTNTTRHATSGLFALAFALLLVTSSAAEAARVRGYTTKRGTRVSAYERTSPDSSKANNWSTKGNVNPYTGKRGSKKATR